MKYTLLALLTFASACSNSPQKRGPIGSVGERLYSVCVRLAANPPADTEALAQLLGGEAVSGIEMRAEGIRSATYFSGAFEARFEVFEDPSINLRALKAYFGEARAIAESKTSSVAFENAPGPCKSMKVTAHLFHSKAQDDSPVMTVRIAP
ncbi:MAG: hypothetical protein ABL958_16330 [Bdellovibrionia bacterium]